MSVRTAHSRWQEPFTVFQTNLQEVDATMDVEAALDVIETHGADTWLVNAGGICAFYPTDLPFHTRNPFLTDRPSGDFLGDAVTAAKRRGLRVIARLDLSKVSARVATEHPDWLFASVTGEPQIYNGLYSTCLSGAFYQRHAVEILDEILDRYPVDGFFFNWFNFNERDYSEVVHGICHCACCAQRFAEFSGGRALPENQHSGDFPIWRRYTDSTIATLARTYSDHVAPRGRDLGLVLRKGAPIVYHEGNNAFLHMPGKDFWPHATAEAVSAHICARPDVPLMLNAVAHIDAKYRLGAEQPEHVAQYLLQAIARGANPSTYILGAPGRLPMASVSLAQRVTRFHRDHHDLYARLRPAATIGLVRPGLGRAGYAAHLRSLEEFRGVYSALQQRHLAFDVLADDELADMAAAGGLDRFRLVVLPGVGALGWAAAEALDEFVAGGGHLLTTGDSGVTTDGAVELACSPALRRSGAELSDKDVWSTYATLDDQHHLDEFRYDGSIVPIFGTNARFVWKPNADRTGSILTQAPWGPPEVSYGHTAGGEPAVASLQYGSGVSAMITWTIGRTYREFGKTEVRDHLLRVLEPLAEVVVSAEITDRVELILGRDDEGYVVHLLNQTGAQRHSFGPHIPVSGGRLVLHGTDMSYRATALVAGHDLESRQDRTASIIELPVIDVFEVVRIRPA
ncbi:alpha-amylase family protein [Nocardia halotolerans]|uniref:Alpha-amylase family protein n=1 Tax=Nocardia halotolerans TaxID=1755878 RepID=A0ABV8VJM1_9NOCA